MPAKTPTDKLLVVTRNLMELFSMPFHAVGETVLTGDAGDPGAAERFLNSYPGGPIGAEAFANHYHLEDFIKDLHLEPRARRRFLMTLAEALVKVWSERLVRLLGERSAIFYIGGRDTVLIRFHVERPGAAPLTSHEPAFIKKERLRVYRTTGGVVERIA
jgi:hypothetical protein